MLNINSTKLHMAQKLIHTEQESDFFFLKKNILERTQGSITAKSNNEQSN